MNFLAPWALLLSVAAAVPLLLHLLRRRSGERVDFPALRYLRRAEREHAREVRLRNFLLLALRVTAVLAIAAALARPIGPFPGVGHPPTAVTLVFDNSASTAAVVGGSTLMEQQRRAARAVLDAARPSDAVTIVTMDGALRSGSPASLRAALDSLPRLDGAGNAAAALRRAEAALAGAAQVERRIVILTDGQASAWAGLADSARTSRVMFVATGARPANHGLLAVTADPPVWSPRGSLRAEWTGDSAAWRISIDDRTLLRGRSAASASIAAALQPGARGWLAGRVELEPDDFRSDDVRHFAVYVGDAPAIAADAGSPFLREAAATLIAGARARAGTRVALVPAVRARTPGIVFAPSDPLQLAAANRALSQAGIPWRFAGARSGPAPLRGAGVEGATATRWFALEAVGDAPADTLATVGRDAWAVAGDGYVLVASPADADATDLPVRAAFLPWLERLLTERLGEAGGRAQEVGAAARVDVPRGATSIEFSDGGLQPLEGLTAWQAPALGGVYFWRRGEQRIGAVVVNPERAELDLAVLPPDSLRAALGVDRVHDTAEATARAAFAAGGRRALDTPLLALALALLVAESWLARRVRSTRPAD